MTTCQELLIVTLGRLDSSLSFEFSIVVTVSCFSVSHGQEGPASRCKEEGYESESWAIGEEGRESGVSPYPHPSTPPLVLMLQSRPISCLYPTDPLADCPCQVATPASPEAWQKRGKEATEQSCSRGRGRGYLCRSSRCHSAGSDNSPGTPASW